MDKFRTFHFSMGSPNAYTNDPNAAMFDRASPNQIQARKSGAIDELLSLPSGLNIRARARWPEGIPLYVNISHDDWWPWPMAYSIAVRPVGSTAEPLSVENRDGVMLAEKLSGVGSLDIQASLWRLRQWIPGAELEHGDDKVVRINYDIRGTADDCISAVTSEALDDILRKGFVYSAGDVKGLSLNPLGTQTEATTGIAFGVIIDHMLDGEVVATQRVWWRGGPNMTGEYDTKMEWIATKNGVSPPHPWMARSGENWTMRIKGDAETALRVIDCDRYWKGEVTMPLNH